MTIPSAQSADAVSNRADVGSASGGKSTQHDAGLVDGEFAYHVMNIKATTELPTVTQLKRNLTNNHYFDGILFSLPCVFFSATLVDGRLPPDSIYPSFAKEGELHRRVRIPLSRFNDYDMYHCRKACSDGSSHEHDDRFLALIFAKKSEAELIPKSAHITKLDKTDNPLLVNCGGRWRVNEFARTGYYVNFVVLGDFDLQFCQNDCSDECRTHCSWDTVTRNKWISRGRADRSEVRPQLERLLAAAGTSLKEYGFQYCKEECPVYCRQHCNWHTVLRGWNGHGTNLDDLADVLLKGWINNAKTFPLYDCKAIQEERRRFGHP